MFFFCSFIDSLHARRLQGKGKGVLGAPRAQNFLSLPYQTPATQAISLNPMKTKCEDQCPSILTKNYGCNIFSILHAQRKSHRRYPRLKMKEERGNLGAWKCKECLAALQVSWVSHKTCQV